MVRERDEFGRDKVIRTYQADGTLVSKREYEYDEYGYITKQTAYSTETNKTFINTYTRDEIGREATRLEDKNANGIFDLGDQKQTMVYDQYLNGNYSERIITVATGTGEKEDHQLYTYDEYDRRASSFTDKNGNKLLDGDEELTKIFHFGESAVWERTEVYTGEELTRIQKLIYPDVGITGSAIAQLYTIVKSDATDLSYGAFGFHYSSKDDYTSEKWRALLDNYENKIIQINLTNARASTDITVDNDVIAKISKNPTLRINGDGTDTVRLKDGSEFTKLEAKVKAGSNEFHQYTTTVEGESYTLQIDTDINVVLA